MWWPLVCLTFRCSFLFHGISPWEQDWMSEQLMPICGCCASLIILCVFLRQVTFDIFVEWHFSFGRVIFRFSVGKNSVCMPGNIAYLRRVTFCVSSLQCAVLIFLLRRLIGCLSGLSLLRRLCRCSENLWSMPQLWKKARPLTWSGWGRRQE